MLIESDLRILTALSSPASISSLSETTGYSISYISERVTYLEEMGLVSITRKGRTKQVRALPTMVLETYHDLTSLHPHIDFPSMISPSMIQVCWFMDRPTTATEMESKLKLRRRRIYQLLEKLQSRGFITKRNDKYVITDRLKEFVRFARTVIRYEHQHRVDSNIPGSRVTWSSPHESLVIPTDDVDIIQKSNWYLTGIQRFSDHGLKFFTAKPTYFFSEIRDTLTPSDLISHTLLVDADTRNLSYCALLMISEETSPQELKKASIYYDIEETVKALVTFVETRGKTKLENLPDWKEFKSLADQYGVNL